MKYSTEDLATIAGVAAAAAAEAAVRAVMGNASPSRLEPDVAKPAVPAPVKRRDPRIGGRAAAKHLKVRLQTLYGALSREYRAGRPVPGENVSSSPDKLYWRLHQDRLAAWWATQPEGL